MADYEIEAPNKVSKYNSAVDQMYRFGEIWRETYGKAKSGDFVMWNLTLDGIWRELAGDLEDNSSEHQEMEKTNTELTNLYPLQSPVVSSFNKRKKDDIIRISKQYALLTKKEIFLRRLQNKLGKGTVLVDSDEDEFD